MDIQFKFRLDHYLISNLESMKKWRFFDHSETSYHPMMIHWKMFDIWFQVIRIIIEYDISSTQIIIEESWSDAW